MFNSFNLITINSNDTIIGLIICFLFYMVLNKAIIPNKNVDDQLNYYIKYYLYNYGVDTVLRFENKL